MSTRPTKTKILFSLVASATIVAGIVTSYSRPQEAQVPQAVPMTVQEFNLLQDMYNIEIEKIGGLQLNNVTSTESLYTQLNDKILKRNVIATTTIGGYILSKEEYKLLRSGLIQKVQTNF